MSIPRRTQLLTIEVTYRADEPRPDTWDWSDATGAHITIVHATPPTDLATAKTVDEIAADLDDDRFGPQDADLDPDGDADEPAPPGWGVTEVPARCACPRFDPTEYDGRQDHADACTACPVHGTH